MLVVKTLFSFSLDSGKCRAIQKGLMGMCMMYLEKICMQVEIDNSRLSSKAKLEASWFDKK